MPFHFVDRNETKDEIESLCEQVRADIKGNADVAYVLDVEELLTFGKYQPMSFGRWQVKTTDEFISAVEVGYSWRNRVMRVSQLINIAHEEGHYGVMQLIVRVLIDWLCSDDMVDQAFYTLGEVAESTDGKVTDSLCTLAIRSLLRVYGKSTDVAGLIKDLRYMGLPDGAKIFEDALKNGILRKKYMGWKGAPLWCIKPQ